MLPQYPEEGFRMENDQSSDWESDDRLHHQHPHHQRQHHHQQSYQHVHLQSHHLHHHQTPHQVQPSLGAPQHHRQHSPASRKVAQTQQGAKINSPNAHYHLAESGQQMNPKMLGIDTYKTDNLFKTQGQPKTDTASHDRPSSHHKRSELSGFQHRCIHAVADMVTSPHTHLPSTTGIFLRPGGTRKAVFNKQLSVYLKEAYRRIDKKPKDFQLFSDLPVMLLPALLLVFLGYIYSLVFGWLFGLSIGISSTVFYLLFVAFALIGGLQKRKKFILPIGEAILRYSRAWRLILGVIFLRPALLKHCPSNVRIIPVRIKLANGDTPWKASVRLSEQMWTAAESKFSKTSLRLQYASDDSLEETYNMGLFTQRFRRTCCLPSWICLIIVFITAPISMIVLRVHFQSSQTLQGLTLLSKIAMIGSAVISLPALLGLLLSSRKAVLQLIKCRSRFRTLARTASEISTANGPVDAAIKRPVVSSDEESCDSMDYDEMPCSHHSYQLRETVSMAVRLVDSRQRALESLLRSENTKTCQALYLLDTRCDRQSRFLVSVDATGCQSTQLVADFSQLINRVLMTPTVVGPINVGVCLQDPRSAAAVRVSGSPVSRNGGDNEDSPPINPAGTNPAESSLTSVNGWNLCFCITSIAATKTKENGKPLLRTQLFEGRAYHVYRECPRVPSVSLLLVCRQEAASGDPITLTQGESPEDSWNRIHDSCHLRIYLDEPPPMVTKLTERANALGSSQKGPPRRARGKIRRSPQSSMDFPDAFANNHPLVDINLPKLQTLMSHFAFLGRLLKTGGVASRPIRLEAAVVWLCVLIHWPFRAAWLRIYLEEHLRTKIACKGAQKRDTKDSSSSDEEGNEDVTNGSALATSRDPNSPTETLSALYCSVVERLEAALAACHLQLQSDSSQQTLSSQHRHAPGGVISSPNLETHTAVRLCGLSASDHSPNRLAEFLINKYRRHLDGAITTASCPIEVATGDLAVLVACSPFLNPHTNAFIQVRRSLQSLRSCDHQRTNPSTAHPQHPPRLPIATSSCPVNLKTGAPRKPLSKMTVDDVCRLVADMVDLSTNVCHRPYRRSISLSDSMTSSTLESPPQSHKDLSTFSRALHHSSSSSFLSSIPYIMKLRALNISGAVLTVCGLSNSLREEIGMNYGDWQLFYNLIQHLKALEGRNCQCAKSMTDLGAQERSPLLLCRPRNTIWTSESILAAATQLRPGSVSRYTNDTSPSPLGSSASSSIITNGQMSQRNTLNTEESVCRLSGGSCSVYSADLSCSSGSSATSWSQRYREHEPIRPKTWRNGVDV